MKAAWTPQYGPASVLDVRDIPTPSIGPDEVLVQVLASPVTAGDLRLRTADFPGVSAVFGRLLMGVRAPKQKVQGTMFSGRVAAIGERVTRFAVGDAVFGSASAGAWAEHVVVRADGIIAHRPDSVTDDEAAAVSYGAETALRFLRDIAGVKAGEHVLILGGSGGVGRFAIQIARWLGARVTAVGSRESLPLMQHLGADAVLDYRTDDFTKTGASYDVIFDIADRSSFRRCRDSLAPGGRYLTLTISLRVLLWMGLTGLLGGKRALFAIVMGNQESTEDLSGLMAEGVVRSVVAARYPLDRIAEAHTHAERRPLGSVVVHPAAPQPLASLG